MILSRCVASISVLTRYAFAPKVYAQSIKDSDTKFVRTTMGNVNLRSSLIVLITSKPSDCPGLGK